MISYTAATGQSGRIATIQVEGSDEQAQFYKLSALQDTATDGTAESFQDLITITGTADTPETRVHQISLGFQYLRVSIKEDGSSNFGTAHIKIVRNEQHT